ncbi:MAG TPA: metalloregulator ArsR/SmtB family transcription factor [Solirubrobacteraceae bacterium]|nr:metalloregulator ArsR/SmtB family transcription factor [Solirubrobacteraceae bacterium]
MQSITMREDPRIGLLKELADPLRLRVIDRLGHGGPATVSRLAAELSVSLPQLSNHLRRLRDAGLVSVRRSGRQAVYELADPGLQQLLPLLDSITGRVLAEAPSETSAPRVPSRTCYDHLGGEIGVSIYRGLRERAALRPRPDGIVELGPAAEETFATLGVEVSALDPGRQRLAFECLDSTERAPHLAGALGDAVGDALVRRRWVRRKPDSRVITLTPSGSRGLRAALGIELSAS